MIKDINSSLIMYKIPLKRLMLIFYLTPKAFPTSLCCPGMYLQLACKTLLLILHFFVKLMFTRKQNFFLYCLELVHSSVYLLIYLSSKEHFA